MGILASINEILSQDNPNNVVSENSQPLQRRPVLSDMNRPARQQRPPQAGFGSLLSGLLGTITKTADVGTCPGKCIHALASLLCEQVREDVQCPDASMRCCVERPRKKKKPTKSQSPLDNNVNDRET